MNDLVSEKYYKLLKSLTNKNGSGFYKFEKEGIKNLLSYLQKYFGDRKSYDLYYRDFLNHKFTVDITEYGVVIAKSY